MGTMKWKVGVDVGGTFTDVCMFDQETGKIYLHKLPSTPPDPSRAIEQGIREILEYNNAHPEDVAYLAHGTTVATNATIERKGCATGLITTEGFRDVLELGRQTRSALYDVQVEKPTPIIRRYNRKQVKERLLCDGSVHIPLDEKDAERAVTELKEQGVVSYAVCLLHSYMNGEHEEKIKEIIKRIDPNAYVSISSEVLPEFREYERTTTTALNSYIGPLIGRYTDNFKAKIKAMGISVTPYINQSNGGLMSIEMTFDNPIRTALSGPAAGVSGANYVAGLAGLKNYITFDMGGTSTDVSLIQNNKPQITTDKAIAEFPVRVPMVDVNAVGAGGGSIAWIDNGGFLKVGPESAGALPGPVCYGRGGTKPTVTDANVVLHRLNPKFILGGKMKIDEEGAYRTIEEHIAKPMGISVVEAALGIVRVVNSNMGRAVRTVSVQRGFDPRDFTLVSFGGAGGLHAADVASSLEMDNIMVPDTAGVLCAVGLLTSDIRSDYVKTKITDLKEENIAEINEIFSGLVNKGNEWLDAEHIPGEQKEIIRRADMRYYGQNFELSVEIPYDAVNEENLEEIKNLFHSVHNREYGYKVDDGLVQIVNFRVIALGKVSTVQLEGKEEHGSCPDHAKVEEREVYFEEAGGFVMTPIYDKKLLQSGNTMIGPAIVEQMDSTIVIPPNYEARIDAYSNIHFTRKNRETVKEASDE